MIAFKTFLYSLLLKKMRMIPTYFIPDGVIPEVSEHLEA